VSIEEHAEMNDEGSGTEPRRVVRYLQAEYVLVGSLPSVGDAAPDFLVTQWVDKLRVRVRVGNLLLEQRPILITTSHTVDAPGSVLQLLQLERMLSRFGHRVRAVHVSSDLPFTLNRCLSALNILHLKAASDYQFKSFEAYGVLMEDPEVLCRSAFVIDKKGIVRYVEVPADFSTELDYEQIAASLDVLLSEDRVNEAQVQESVGTSSDACPNEGDGLVEMEV
jgi:thioredoxin-dependent peroxiredoxin